MTSIDDLGFSAQDWLLLAACPIAAALGSFVHFLITDVDTQRPPKIDMLVSRRSRHLFVTIEWLLRRLFVGAAAGLLVALFFVGALKPGATVVARIVGLSVLVGYAAPKLWLRQETLITAVVDRRLRELANEHNDTAAVAASQKGGEAPDGPAV